MGLEDDIKKILIYYKEQDKTKRDVLNAMEQYKGLELKQDIYTFTDGSKKRLIHLIGTIPVLYMSSTYNIPVVIWLMDTHPQNAPICYVKPTPTMQIKVSMFVDQNGKIYLPYLHDWDPKDSDLLGLIQVLIVTFGEKPPVFAKPKEQQQMPSYMPSSNVAVGPGYPPPYPAYGMPSSSGPASALGGPYNTPYPPAPLSGTPNTAGYPPYPSYPPSSGVGGYPSIFPIPNLVPVAPLTGSGGPNETIRNEHIRDSLLTCIEEKLMRRMKEQFQQNQAELDTLKRTQQELSQGKARLETILEQLRKEKNDLDRNIAVLKDKEQELDKAIEKLSNEETIDVDDAVTTTAPLYKQLLNAFAEEAALEDAIYYMGEALRCGVIDLDIFLRQDRTLSRKQFMLRALMQKCRQKAGLIAI